MKAEKFFSVQEKAEIAESVRQVELQTSGEVVVMLVDESDTYPEGRILAGGALGGVLALVVCEAFLAASLWWFVPLALGLIALCGWLIVYIPSGLRLFVHPAKLEQRVVEQALLAFYRHGLHHTRDATGVLFFISLFERKVRVMADKGIYEKITQETLQEYADNIALGVRNGKAAAAICHELARAGQILAEHFPIKPDDTNELSNEVIVGR